MKPLLAILFTLLLANAQQLVAAVPFDAVPATRLRYLFVVDTSRSMEKANLTTRRTIEELILNGFVGQAKKGDTFSIWTFNEDIFPYDFPAMVWDPELSTALANTTGQFLRSRPNRRKAQLDRVMSAVIAAAKYSDPLTIFLITDGSEQIHGTPFDTAINSSFKQGGPELRKQKRPFVIALLAVEGHFIAEYVNAAGGEMRIPVFHELTQVAKSAPPEVEPLPTPPPALPQAFKPVPIIQPLPEPTPPPKAAPPVVTAPPQVIPESAPPIPSPTPVPIPTPPPVLPRATPPAAMIQPVAQKENLDQLPPAASVPKAPPTVAVTPKPQPIATPVAMTTQPQPTPPQTVTKPVSKPTPILQPVLAAEEPSRAKYVWIGSVLLLLAAGLYYLHTLQKRPAITQSLISQSMEKPPRR